LLDGFEAVTTEGPKLTEAAIKKTSPLIEAYEQEIAENEAKRLQKQEERSKKATEKKAEQTKSFAEVAKEQVKEVAKTTDEATKDSERVKREEDEKTRQAQISTADSIFGKLRSTLGASNGITSAAAASQIDSKGNGTAKTDQILAGSALTEKEILREMQNQTEVISNLSLSPVLA